MHEPVARASASCTWLTFDRAAQARRPRSPRMRVCSSAPSETGTAGLQIPSMYN